MSVDRREKDQPSKTTTTKQLLMAVPTQNDDDNDDGEVELTSKWCFPDNKNLELDLKDIREWTASSLKNWQKAMEMRDRLQSESPELEEVSREVFVNADEMGVVLINCFMTMSHMFRSDPTVDGLGSIADRLRAVLNRFDDNKAEFDRIIAMNKPRSNAVQELWNKLSKNSSTLVNSLDPHGGLFVSYFCQSHHGCWFSKFYYLIARAVAKDLPDHETRNFRVKRTHYLHWLKATYVAIII